MPKIVDQYGRPIETGSLTEAQSAKLLSLTRNFQTHPSRGLTPARLAQILEQAEQGDVLLQLELYEDMTEKDGHLYAELAKRQRALLTVDWDIAPPPNATEAEKSAAADIKERFESLGDFEDVILGAAAAIGPAFSCQEIEWELVGRDWMPKCIDFPAAYLVHARSRNAIAGAAAQSGHHRRGAQSVRLDHAHPSGKAGLPRASRSHAPARVAVHLQDLFDRRPG
jgi:phage gp29-like protein